MDFLNVVRRERSTAASHAIRFRRSWDEAKQSFGMAATASIAAM
jgi:hypothetical protein